MKTSFYLLSMTFALLFSSCKNNPSTNSQNTTEPETKEPAAVHLWTTDATLTGSESALYDPNSDMIFVSCGNTKPWEKDGDGTIARVRTDGTIENKDWATGLHAPKGMAILGNSLFVTDIDEMVEISLADGKILNKIPIEGAQKLNDAASDGEYVYFSDMGDHKIYRMADNRQYESIAKNVTNINGVDTYNGDVYGLNADGLIKLDGEGGFDVILDDIKGGDGLAIIDENTFIASLWAGQVFYIQGDQITKVIDTKAEESNTADIWYIAEKKIILVPTFFKNEIAAYRLN